MDGTDDVEEPEEHIRLPEDVPLIAKDLGVSSNAVAGAIRSIGLDRRKIYAHIRRRKKCGHYRKS